jgi:hypothetical protein
MVGDANGAGTETSDASVPAGLPDEVVQQSMAMFTGHRLGMKLYPLDRMGAVPYAHDLAIVRKRGQLEFGRHTVA